MTATQTRDIDATVAQVNALAAAGADVVRIAVDSPAEAEALAEIRRQTTANLSVDLQENYRLAERVAPHVDKLRYNPGHLYHHEREKPWQEKVRYLVDVARDNDCAMRVGVNCGSVDPAQQAKYDPSDTLSPMLDSALEHCRLLDELGFTRYCVSLKDSESAGRDRGQPPLRRGPAGRAAAPGRHRSRPAAGRHHQDADRLRAAHQPRHRRHDPRLAHRAERPQAGGDRRRPADSGRHRGRPRPLGRRLRPVDAEHHQLPELLAGRERGVRRAGRGREADDRVRQASTRSRSP